MMNMRPDAKCVYPVLMDEMKRRLLSWTDIQLMIRVSPAGITRRRKGETPFSELEQLVISDYFDIDKQKLFSREEVS